MTALPSFIQVKKQNYNKFIERNFRISVQNFQHERGLGLPKRIPN